MRAATRREALERKGWRVIQRDVVTTPCWEWKGTVMRNGYGYVWLDGRQQRVHRVAYLEFVGPIPEGLGIRHLCSNARCIRPEHLLPGTQLENLADMVAARRSANGERNAAVKLTDDEVADIRDDYANGRANQYELAEQYGVHQTQISNIVRGVSRAARTYGALAWN